MSTAVAPKKAAPVSQPSTEMAREKPAEAGMTSLNHLRREFDELWNKFFTGMPAQWNADKADLHWSFDMADEPEAFVVKAQAPGFEAKDFNVELRGDQLVLQAHHAAEEQEAGKHSFSSRDFYRAMQLPPHVAADQISADYQDGMLQVRLPKTEEGKGRKIAVKG